MLEIGLPRLRMSWRFLQDLSRVFHASPGAQLQEITVSVYSIQLGQLRLTTNSDRIGKNDHCRLTQRLFDPTGSNTIIDYKLRSDRKKIHFSDPIGDFTCWIEKVLTVISCNWAPREKRETALDRSQRNLQVILRRGRSIFYIFGATAHANVLEGTFSTDCKSNCIHHELPFLLPDVEKKTALN